MMQILLLHSQHSIVHAIRQQSSDQHRGYLEEHLLLTQLLGYVVGTAARHFNPGLGEQRTG